MKFSERYGFIPTKCIQIESMDESLRNRLFNITMKFLTPSFESNEIIEFVVDKRGYISGQFAINNMDVFKRLFLNLDEQSKWYTTYEIIELIIEAKRWQCNKCIEDCHALGRDCIELTWVQLYSQVINDILEKEKAGYRMVNDIFVPITSDEELNSIRESVSTQFDAVNIHIKKALALYADRKTPDYENSIKESISAVEAMCCIITGLTGPNATLGKAIKKLKENGVVIHNSLEIAFSKLYGYTSDANGIRHGGIDFTNAPAEDAMYMLVSCSAFVNYLIVKYSELGVKTNG